MEVGIFTSNNDLISIRAMGEGVANVLGLIAILLTENGKLFLIEELENDIHPGALKKLLELIIEKSDSNQFIISTHSNIVAKYLGSKEDTRLFYLDWTKNDPESGSNVPTSNISIIPNTPLDRIDVLEKLGYDFFDFDLYQYYLLLEESSAERIIRDFIIPKFCPKLQNKVKTIAANGVDDLESKVIDFSRLFVFIHTSEIYFKRAWVIADGDIVGGQIVEKLKSQFKTWPAEHFFNWKEQQFEYYYPGQFREEAQKIIAIENKQEKRKQKKQLFDEVWKWIAENEELAIKEFEISAKEVIAILKGIEEKIK